MTITKWHRGCISSCLNCQKDFKQYRPNHYLCSYKCGYSYQNKTSRSPIKINIHQCKRCSTSLIHKKINAIYCSKTCKSMDHTLKHRAKTRTQKIARRYDIYLRDNGTCYMCLKSLPLSEVELDHILPVALGGSSDPQNIAISCRSCNRRKGTTIGQTQLLKLLEIQE